MKLRLESAKILTLSTAHLHPQTIEGIEILAGEINEGPSIAVRETGFLVNTHLGTEDAALIDCTDGQYQALNHRMPDLCLLRAIGRGQGAAWLCIDADGEEYPDILPVYRDGEEPEMPSHPVWSGALVRRLDREYGSTVLQASPETLETLSRPHQPEQDAAPGLEM